MFIKFAGVCGCCTSYAQTSVVTHVWLLLSQGERALQMDVQEGARLQLHAFEAINDVVRSASPDTLPLVSQLIPALLDKLGSTIRMQVSSIEAKEHQSEMQVGFPCMYMPILLVP